MQKKSSLIGQKITVPLSIGEEIEGEIIAHNEVNEEISVIDVDGFIYKGYIYQASLLW